MNSTTASLAQNERIQRLDREMMHEGKGFDYLFAVSGEYRIRVCVFKTQDGYAATCKIGGHVHRASHATPGNAFAKLVQQLRWRTAQLAVEKRLGVTAQ